MRGRSVVRVRVHIALVALLAAVICGTAGSMLLVQIEGSRRIVRDSAFTYMDAVGLRVVDRTAALVDPIIRVLRVLATRPALLETTTPANGEILPGFLAALRQDPDLYLLREHAKLSCDAPSKKQRYGQGDERNPAGVEKHAQA
jgi:hypothetical protein